MVEVQFQELLYKSWIGLQEHSAGGHFSAVFFLKDSLPEVFVVCVLVFVLFNLSPVSHQKLFSSFSGRERYLYLCVYICICICVYISISIPPGNKILLEGRPLAVQGTSTTSRPLLGECSRNPSVSVY